MAEKNVMITRERDIYVSKFRLGRRTVKERFYNEQALPGRFLDDLKKFFEDDEIYKRIPTIINHFKTWKKEQKQLKKLRKKIL